VIFIACSLCLEHIRGQEFPSLKFSHITEKEGLSNSEVRAITQDSQGFVWIATADGLNRLDGYRIKTFYHHPDDSSSLVNNDIIEILPDNKSNLWIATGEGISRYNAALNNFSNFHHKEGDLKSLKADNATSLFLDTATNNVWINVENFLYCFNENLHYTSFSTNALQLPPVLQRIPINYFHLYKDKEQQLWAYFRNWIFKLDNQTKKITASFHTSAAHVISLFEDNKHQYFVATFGGGMLLFNPGDNSFSQISLSGNPYVIYAISEWRDKNNHDFIVAGTDKGLELVDPQTLLSKLYTTKVLYDYSILDDDVSCLFVDRQNILWVGTAGGLSYAEPSKQLIETWSITTVEEKLKNNFDDFVYSFFQDSGYCLVTDWKKTGLFQYSNSGTLLRVIEDLYPPMHDSLSYKTTRAFGMVKLDSEKFLFTTNAGLVEYSLRNHHSKFYSTGDGNPDPGLRTILQYDDSTFWIRTRNNGYNGIYVFNSKQKKMVQHYYYSPECSDCLPPYLADIIITRDKNILTCPRNNYLYIYSKPQNKFIPFFTSPKQTVQLPGKTFNCIIEDAAGNLWVGTSSGLFELNAKTKDVIKDYSKDKKLGGIGIETLCFDDDKNLWMSTERGLFCLIYNSNNVFNFNAGDGLPGNSVPGFLYKGKNGYMYAGVLGYIIKFKPAELLHQRTSGAVRFSEVEVMNRPYPIVQNNKNEKQLTLKPGENIFTLDFSVLNYDNTAGNRYYYEIDGLMDGWKENENGHLSFYNLSTGEYLLHVKGSDKYGNSFLSEDEIAIEVIPYWWQTKCFFAALTLLMGVIIYLLVRRRIKIIRKESSFKTKIAETEMIALRAQMNPHFIFNCMNIIDGLITENRKEEAKDFLQKFSKLVRLVLENSQHQLVLLSSDLKTLELYTEMEAIRYNHRFTYTFNVEGELLEDNYKIPPLLLQPYIENAIVHGLRHKEDGAGKLLITMKNENGKLFITIEDNGIGRKRAEEINKENGKPHQQLGMKVTEKRIELLKAIDPDAVIQLEIRDLNDNGRSGTIVQIILPLEFDFKQT
jgi:ligand-binding sensor domain-containing protein